MKKETTKIAVLSRPFSMMNHLVAKHRWKLFTSLKELEQHNLYDFAQILIEAETNFSLYEEKYSGWKIVSRIQIKHPQLIDRIVLFTKIPNCSCLFYKNNFYKKAVVSSAAIVPFEELRKTGGYEGIEIDPNYCFKHGLQIFRNIFELPHSHDTCLTDLAVRMQVVLANFMTTTKQNWDFQTFLKAEKEILPYLYSIKKALVYIRKRNEILSHLERLNLNISGVFGSFHHIIQLLKAFEKIGQLQKNRNLLAKDFRVEIRKAERSLRFLTQYFEELSLHGKLCTIQKQIRA